MRPWWDDAMRQLDSLAALPLDWDSYGATQPAPPAVAQARAVAAVVALIIELGPKLAPQFVPVPDGGVMLVWAEQGWDAEVEINPAGEVSVWARHGRPGPHFEWPPDQQ